MSSHTVYRRLRRFASGAAEQAPRVAVIDHLSEQLGLPRTYLRLGEAPADRETTTDEKIEVRIPRQCTTAKPRTGPEPKISSARPAISVVMLESRMVLNARS